MEAASGSDKVALDSGGAAKFWKHKSKASRICINDSPGRVPEWTKGTDCKSVGESQSSVRIRPRPFVLFLRFVGEQLFCNDLRH